MALPVSAISSQLNKIYTQFYSLNYSRTNKGWSKYILQHLLTFILSFSRVCQRLLPLCIDINNKVIQFSDVNYFHTHACLQNTRYL